MIRKYEPNIRDINSAATTDHQTPLIPQISGKIITAMLCKTKVLTKAIIAEVSPSFSAVKKPEANIPKPIKPKERAKTLNPEKVKL